jgi:hypothetical protein
MRAKRDTRGPVPGGPPALLAPALALAVAVALGACAGGSGGGGPDPDAAPDTVRGTVLVVGADPMTRVVLRTGDGRLDLEGPEADRLRRVNGLGVRVDGRIDGAAMTVTGFRVREADGLPAADGILELDGDAAVLVTAAGERLRYTPVPSALRARAGERVWIAGAVGGEPQAWGVIGGD